MLQRKIKYSVPKETPDFRARTQVFLILKPRTTNKVARQGEKAKRQLFLPVFHKIDNFRE